MRDEQGTNFYIGVSFIDDSYRTADIEKHTSITYKSQEFKGTQG